MDAVERVWVALQVEHQGLYSFERAKQMLAYMSAPSCSMSTLVVLLFTPVPCILALTLIDSIPLQDPSLGPRGNWGFVIRSLFAVMVYTTCIVGQINSCVPGLIRIRNLLWIAPVVSLATNTGNYLMSLCIGFPLPFTHVLGLAPWITSLMLSLWVALGRSGRQSPILRRAFTEHGALLMVQSSLGVVYPLFYRVFLISTPTAQLFVVLLLPVIKVAMKFRINQVTPHIADLQPLTVTFNAEVFNSLFTASCMQGSSSAVTTIALMAIDFLHATYSLYRLSGLVNRVDQLGREFGMSRERMLPVLVDLANKIPPNEWEKIGVPIKTHGPNTTVNETLSASRRPKVTSSATTRSILHYKPSRVSPNVSTSPSNVTSPKMTAIAPAPSVNASFTARSEGTIQPAWEANTSMEQMQCAKQVLVLFRRTEYLLLIEYTEVMVPFVYATYLGLTFNLPTRAYYPLLQHVNSNTIGRVVRNIYLYGGLQLLSFILLVAFLHRRLRVAAHHQVQPFLFV